MIQTRADLVRPGDLVRRLSALLQVVDVKPVIGVDNVVRFFLETGDTLTVVTTEYLEVEPGDGQYRLFGLT